MLRTLLSSILLVALSAWVLHLPYLHSSTEKSLQLPFLVSNAEQAFVMVGSPECQSTCPIGLAVLTDFLDTAKKKLPTQPIEVVFWAPHDLPLETTAESYAQSFHPDFTGMRITPSQTTELNQQLKSLQPLPSILWLKQREGQWFLQKTFTPKSFSVSQVFDALEK